MKSIILLFLLTLTMGAEVKLPPISGRSVENQALLPADVLARTEMVARDIEEIRKVMGKPKGLSEAFKISGAEPRHVFHQAGILYLKVRYLCSEFHIDTEEPNEIDSQLNIKPTQVFLLVNKSFEMLQQLKAHPDFNITAQNKEEVLDDSLKPQDVFRTIVVVNSQLDQMLATKASPSDVYRKLDECSQYVQTMCKTLKVQNPVKEGIYAHKVPGDVFKKLTECFKTLSTVNRISDINSLEVEFIQTDSISPNEVYSLSSLIYSELKYLHEMNKMPPVEQTFYPGRKFPAHCNLKADILKQQLHNLFIAVRQNTDLLKNKGE